MKRLLFILLLLAGCTGDSDITVTPDYAAGKLLIPLRKGNILRYIRFDNSKQHPDTIIVETITERVPLILYLDTLNKEGLFDTVDLYTFSSNTINDYDFAALGQYVERPDGLVTVDIISGYYFLKTLAIPRTITNGKEMLFRGEPHIATWLPRFKNRFNEYAGNWQLTPINPRLSRKVFNPSIGLIQEFYVENGDTLQVHLLR